MTTHSYYTRSARSKNIEFNHDKTYERILIFDVETTGLPKYSFVDSTSTLQSQPHIIQLSYLILQICKETKEFHVDKEFDEYIRLPKNQTIPSFITNLTGITNEKCAEGGKNMPDVLFQFCMDYKSCNVVVSHNLKFDSKMILIEMSRHWPVVIEMGLEDPYCIFNPIYNAMHNIALYCTMTNSVRVCNLKNAKGSLKNPKLTELFTFVFPNTHIPENLHNAKIDTWVCYYCYLKLTHPELDVLPDLPTLGDTLLVEPSPLVDEPPHLEISYV